jgi:hypothetical protein
VNLSWIYVLIDPRTGDIRYVGRTVRPKRRLSQHLAMRDRDQAPRAVWIRSLVRQGYLPLLEVVQAVPVDFCAEAEAYWIDHFRSLGCALLNKHKEVPVGWNEEVRRRQSAIATVLMADPARRAAVSKVHSGKTISPEHRAIVSAAAKRRWEEWRATGQTYSPESIARMSAAAKRRGPLSEEHKAKLSAATKGRSNTAEHNARISAGLRGKPKSPEHAAKIAERNRAMAAAKRMAKSA